MSRTIGKVIQVSKQIQQMSRDEISKQILFPLWENGVICVKGQDMSPGDLKNMASQMGEPVLLPAAFSFNNRDPENPEIVRVGNVNLDGTIRKSVTDAEYWHHDGNFWPAPKNHIINALHNKKNPSNGGNTGFLDLIKPLQDNFFSPEILDQLVKSSLLVKTKNIADFKNAPAEHQMPDQIHPCIKKHPINGLDAMYLPRNPKGLYNTETKEQWISNEKIWDMMAEGGYMYEHEWEEGDVLFWDNMACLHRSMGGFFDEPRLLFRVQARYHERQAQEFY